ncbi:sensor histidine kinase [Saccharicrinis sp. FJH62]|uniref:sensor histidine kinase n=1 Tax=Saccharicrinis sp. FJH62 TaxID=3344657 RepID=UPI0035D4F18F
MNREKEANLNKRYSPDILDSERSLIMSLEYFKDVFNSISTVAFVLNSTRQVIFASNETLQLLDIETDKILIGMRPGEVVSCIHASETPHGCNTSDSCKYCGLFQTLNESQRQQDKVTSECRISSSQGDKTIAYDFSVSSVPVRISHNIYYIVSLIDISSDKRKEQMEKIFFHDLVNSVGGISGLMEYLDTSSDLNKERDIFSHLKDASKDILEQIISFKQLLNAESGELKVDFIDVSAVDIIQSSVDIISKHEVVKGKKIDFSGIENIRIYTDKALLTRIMVNMLKNAAEAVNERNSVIQIGAGKTDSIVKFWVKNDYVMPDSIQKQIFQRSFSSKGNGRGLGTYSMKILGENYLNGKVGFTSNKTDGTTFFIDLPTE